MTLKIKIAIETLHAFVYTVDSMYKSGKVSMWLVIVLVVLGGTLGASYILRQKSPVVIQKARMGGNSMAPLFKDGDEISINTAIQRNSLRRGDIVVFKIKDPGYPADTSVKRIIAMSGDTIKLVKGDVFLNNSKLEEPYLAKQSVTSADKALPEGSELRIPEGMIFLLGDEREHSYDSRKFGSIKIDDIIASVVVK